MIVPLAYVMLILGLGPAALYVTGKLKDPFHPLILVGAISFFISAQSLLTAPGPAAELLGAETFVRYLSAAIISLLGFYLGWKVSKGRDQKRFSDAQVMKLPSDGTLVAIAAFCAIVADVVFAFVYGKSTLSGYVRDWTNLWITAAILMMQVLSHRERSAYRTPAIMVLCLSLIPPVTLFWTYGQRGDTIRLALIASIFYLMRNIRPRKATFLICAVVVSLVLATLAETREIIREDPAKNRITALVQVIPHYVRAKTETYSGSEEFMFGAALVQSTAETGNYEMGKAWTLRLISRFAPKEYFADKWAWFGTSAGSEFEVVKEHFGFIIPGGAAISGVAQGYFELGWFCPAIWFLLGFVHQKLWYRAINSARRQYVGYLTAFNIAMVYAVSQDIYVAEMNMIYVIGPLYLAYRFASVPVEVYEAEHPSPDMGSPLPA